MANIYLHLIISLLLFCDTLISESISNVLENSGNLENIANITSFLKDYDKLVRPNSGEVPVEVAVKISVLEIVSINEVDLDWTCSVYIEQTWNDSRLQFDKDFRVSSIIYAQKDPELFWTPDLHFLNEKKSDLGDYSTGNSYLKLYPDGFLEMHKKETMKSKCDMDFHFHPFGFFSCTMRLRSFSYPPKDLQLKWKNGAIDSVSLNFAGSYHQFIYVGVLVFDETDANSEHGSELKFQLFFRRYALHYLFQWFLPSGALVLLSFLAFWLDRKAISERIGLGMTSILAITLMWNSVGNSLPQTTYAKGVDFYFGSCFVLCSCSVIVNACIGYLELQKKNIQIQNHSRFGRWMWRLIIKKNLPAVLDRCAKITFPLLFFGCGVIYTILYVPDINKNIEELKKQSNFHFNKNF